MHTWLSMAAAAAAATTTEQQPPPLSWDAVPTDKLRDRYTINKGWLLGKGAYGRVYQVKDDVWPQGAFAAKVVPYRNASECYRKEVKAFEQLRTATVPHLVRLHDHFRHERFGILIFDHVPGVLLGKRLDRRGGLSTAEALPLFLQVVQAVEVMHKNYVSPRDLKADNLIYNVEEGRVTLIDLGMAIITSANDLVECSSASPLYAAPEVVLLRAHRSFLHDIWCLGQTLYHMLAGLPLYNECRTLEQLRPIMKRQAPHVWPQWMPPKVKTLLTNLLEWKPSKRPTLEMVRVYVEYIAGATLDDSPRASGDDDDAMSCDETSAEHTNR